MAYENYVTPRFYPDFDMPLAEKRRATYEDVYEVGLGKYLDSGEAVHLDYLDGYHIVTWPPTGLADPYNSLIYVMPDAKHTIAATLDQLPPSVCHSLLTNSAKTVEAIRNVAANRGHSVGQANINQHVGPREVNGHKFSTTLPQIHLHIHAYDQGTVDQFPNLFTKTDQRIPNSKYLFHDPTVKIAYEMAAAVFPDAEIFRDDCSISFISRAANEPISIEEAVHVMGINSFWQRMWDETALAYTAFELDSNGRYIPQTDEDHGKQLEDFITQNPYLSAQSTRLMRWLHSNVKPSEGQDLWRWFFKGASGTQGYVYNFEEDTRHFVVAPRLRVVPKKNWALFPRTTHVIDKARGMEFTEDQFLEAKQIQLEINTELIKLAGK